MGTTLPGRTSETGQSVRGGQQRCRMSHQRWWKFLTHKTLYSDPSNVGGQPVNVSNLVGEGTTLFRNLVTISFKTCNTSFVVWMVAVCDYVLKTCITTYFVFNKVVSRSCTYDYFLYSKAVFIQ